MMRDLDAGNLGIDYQDALFGAVYPLFLFSILGKSCDVNLPLFSSYFNGIGLLREYFLSTPLTYFVNLNKSFNLFLEKFLS